MVIPISERRFELCSLTPPAPISVPIGKLPCEMTWSVLVLAR